MSRAPGTKTVAWLLPSEPQRRALAATIADLASRFGRAPFAPHTTLGTVTANDLAAFVTTANDALTAEVVASVIAVRQYGEQRRALVLDLKMPPAYEQLRSTLTEVGMDRDPVAPHLSLGYHELGRTAFDALHAELAPAAPRRIACSEVQVWQVPASTRDIDPALWRQLA